MFVLYRWSPFLFFKPGAPTFLTENRPPLPTMYRTYSSDDITLGQSSSLFQFCCHRKEICHCKRNCGQHHFIFGTSSPPCIQYRHQKYQHHASNGIPDAADDGATVFGPANATKTPMTWGQIPTGQITPQLLTAIDSNELTFTIIKTQQHGIAILLQAYNYNHLGILTIESSVK